MNCPLAENVDQFACLLKGIAARTSGRVNHARSVHCELEELAVPDWKIDDLLVFDHVFHYRRFRLKQPGAVFDNNDLRLLCQGECEIVADTAARMQNEILLESLFESVSRDRK